MGAAILPPDCDVQPRQLRLFEEQAPRRWAKPAIIRAVDSRGDMVEQGGRSIRVVTGGATMTAAERRAFDSMEGGR